MSSSSRVGAVAVVLLACGLSFATEPPKSIALLDFEIEDDTLKQGGPSDEAAHARRMLLAGEQIRAAFQASGKYQVLDNAPASATIERLRKTYDLHDCNSCEVDVGRELAADLIAVGWVQKVSNLILNLNIGIRDVKTGQVMMVRSVDVRGDTDESWRRGAARLAQNILDGKRR